MLKVLATLLCAITIASGFALTRSGHHSHSHDGPARPAVELTQVMGQTLE